MAWIPPKAKPRAKSVVLTAVETKAGRWYDFLCTKLREGKLPARWRAQLDALPWFRWPTPADPIVDRHLEHLRTWMHFRGLNPSKLPSKDSEDTRERAVAQWRSELAKDEFLRKYPQYRQAFADAEAVRPGGWVWPEKRLPTREGIHRVLCAPVSRSSTETSVA